jgi:hypothetical protein
MARRLSRRADPCQYSKWRLRTDLRLGPADVMLQRLDHELPVADDAPDQITDRDDAEKFTIIDHRQMAHALGAHDRHAFRPIDARPPDAERIGDLEAPPRG